MSDNEEMESTATEQRTAVTTNGPALRRRVNVNGVEATNASRTHTVANASGDHTGANANEGHKKTTGPSASAPSSTKSTQRTPSRHQQQQQQPPAYIFYLILALLLIGIGCLGFAGVLYMYATNSGLFTPTFGSRGHAMYSSSSTFSRPTDPTPTPSFALNSDSRNGLRHNPNIQPIMMEVLVPLNVAYNGGEIDVMLSNRQHICPVCSGTGAKGAVHTCPVCRGSGQQLIERQLFPGMVVQQQEICHHCHGRGQIFEHACDRCGGQGVFKQTKAIKVPIERGMLDGSKVSLIDQGHEVPRLGVGSVELIISVRDKEGLFTRVGVDLHVTLQIQLWEAIRGFKRVIRHLDGREIIIDRENNITDPIVQDFIPNAGMPLPSSSGFGDLYIKFEVEFPKRLSTEQKSLIKQVLHK